MSCRQIPAYNDRVVRDERRGVVARQRELAGLLHERHWSQGELAERIGVSVRTLQRYFEDFEEVLGVSVPRDRAGFYLEPGMHPVPIVELELGEARTLLFAMRQLLHSTVEQDADAFTLLDKLAVAFPGPIAEQVSITRAQLGERPENKRRQGILRRLTDAWVRGEIVAMRYRSVQRSGSRTVCFEPWVLEPSATTGATYIVGYNHTRHAVATFKLDRVTQIERHPERCMFAPEGHPPAPREELAALMDRMGRSWSRIATNDDGDHRIIIDFSGDAARRVTEGPWHRARTFQELGDGVVRMRIDLPALFDFVPWVLGFGGQAVVVEPEDLRMQVAGELREGAANYDPA